MKLPGIKYTRPVQSLGRQDVNAPLRVANAWASAADKWSAEIQAIDTANKEIDLAAAQSRINREMAVLEGELESKKQYSTAELDELGIKYNPVTQIIDPESGQLVEAEREFIPSHEVSQQIYGQVSSNILKSETDKLSDRKYKAKLGLHHSRLFARGAEQIVANKNRDKALETSANVDLQYEAAVNAGDETGAVNIAKAAIATGMWTPEHFQRQTQGVTSEIRGNQYTIATSTTEDLGKLNRLKIEAAMDDKLSASDRARSLSALDSKIQAITTRREAAAKAAKVEQSYQRMVELSTQIQTQGPMPPQQLADEASGLTKPDYIFSFNLNKAKREGPTKSDSQVLNRLTVMVRGLSIPGDDDITSRRAHITQELNRAMGYDPVTGDKVGPTLLKPEDYNRLYTAINTSSEFNIDNPEVKIVSDYIWTTLTGSSKTGMGTFLDQPGVHSARAADAEYALNRAAMNGGPSFDPHKWWDDNKVKYISKQVQSNLEKAGTLKDGSSTKSNIVTDDEGKVDQKATVQGLKSKFGSGAISKEDVQRAANAAMLGE